MLIDLLVKIFLFLLITITFLVIVVVLGFIAMVVSGVKREIRKNNDEWRK